MMLHDFDNSDFIFIFVYETKSNTINRTTP